MTCCGGERKDGPVVVVRAGAEAALVTIVLGRARASSSVELLW